MAWAQTHGIHHILIQPGRPMQNGYIESFNGKFRDEHLDESWFETLQQAGTFVAQLAHGLHPSRATQQSGTHTTGSFCRTASPARWRCSSTPFDSKTNRLTLDMGFRF